MRSVTDIEAKPRLQPHEIIELRAFHIRVTARGIMEQARREKDCIALEAAEMIAEEEFDRLPNSEQEMMLIAHRNDLDARDD